MTLAYATYFDATDAAAELKNINFTTNTNITPARLDDLCDRTQAIVDGAVNLRYYTPITVATMPQATLVLKEICAKLTAAHIDEILRQNGITINSEEKKKLTKLQSDADAMLQAIKEDRLLLIDAHRRFPVSATISGSEPPTAAVTQSIGVNAINMGPSMVAFPPVKDGRTFQGGQQQW